MSNWPMLKHYDRDHLASIAMPIGGIGTGTISLGGRGDLRDWELMNRPAKGFVPRGEGGRGGGPFFALYAKPAGGPSVTRALEGPVDVAEYQGASGSVAVNHGLPRFAQCAFAAAYPLAQVQLSDPQVPVAVCLEAFNPLIPANADDSGIPHRGAALHAHQSDQQARRGLGVRFAAQFHWQRWRRRVGPGQSQSLSPGNALSGHFHGQRRG